MGTVCLHPKLFCFGGMSSKRGPSLDPRNGLTLESRICTALEPGTSGHVQILGSGGWSKAGCCFGGTPNRCSPPHGGNSMGNRPLLGLRGTPSFRQRSAWINFQLW